MSLVSRCSASLALILSLFCLASITRSAGYAVQESSFEVEGTIRKQAAGKLTVDSGQGILFRVLYDDKTALSKQDGGAASEKELKPGTRIHVSGSLQPSGELKADKIAIVAGKADVRDQ